MRSLVSGMLALPGAVRAQSDEIQVYDGGLAAKGVFNLTTNHRMASEAGGRDLQSDSRHVLRRIEQSRVGALDPNAYNTSSAWAIAVEEYADYGPLRGFAPAASQAHQLFAVVDLSAGSLDVESGVGVGLSNATDRGTFKLILSHDLNKPGAKTADGR